MHKNQQRKVTKNKYKVLSLEKKITFTGPERGEERAYQFEVEKKRVDSCSWQWVWAETPQSAAMSGVFHVESCVSKETLTKWSKCRGETWDGQWSGNHICPTKGWRNWVFSLKEERLKGGRLFIFNAKKGHRVEESLAWFFVSQRRDVELLGRSCRREDFSLRKEEL